MALFITCTSVNGGKPTGKLKSGMPCGQRLWPDGVPGRPIYKPNPNTLQYYVCKTTHRFGGKIVWDGDPDGVSLRRYETTLRDAGVPRQKNGRHASN